MIGGGAQAGQVLTSLNRLLVLSEKYICKTILYPSKTWMETAAIQCFSETAQYLNIGNSYHQSFVSSVNSMKTVNYVSSMGYYTTVLVSSNTFHKSCDTEVN